MAERVRWLDETEMRAWTVFLDCSVLLRRRIDSQLREAGGLTQPHYELLTRLEEQPEHRLRMSDLAERLATSRSGLTYQVTQLEKAGLVRREPSADDERVSFACLTQQGQRLLRESAPGHVRVVRDGFVDRLDREQLEQLAAALEPVRRHLRAATMNS